MQVSGVPWNSAMLSEKDVECATGQPWCPGKFHPGIPLYRAGTIGLGCGPDRLRLG